MHRQIAHLEQALAQLVTPGQDRLAHRVKVDLVGLAKRALRRRIVKAQRLDEIAIKLNAHREAIQRHEHVENPAAHRKRPRIFTDGSAGVATLQEALDRQITIQLLLGSDDVNEIGKRILRHHPPRQRFHRRDHHLRRQHTALRQPKQR
jgi:hypothetical protein